MTDGPQPPGHAEPQPQPNGSRDVWVVRMAMGGLIAVACAAIITMAAVDPADQGARAGLVGVASGAVTGLVAALAAGRRIT